MRKLYSFLAVTCSFNHFRVLFVLINGLLPGLPLLLAQPLPGDEQIHQLLYQSDIQYQRKTDQLENLTHQQMRSGPQTLSNHRAVLTIPVVVHIMHPLANTSPGSPGHPTNLQIEAGINWLNQAFRNTGDYAGGPFYSSVTQAGIQSVDTEIEFCLAQVAPDGSPTQGITRTGTAFSDVAFNQIVSGTATQDQILKSLAFWDANQYLNVWVVNSVCEYTGVNCDVPGYAYLPGAHGSPLDGIVIEGQYFGTHADNNAVATYYFARYLNLWRSSYRDLNRPDCDNDDCSVRGDRVCDTPPDATLGGPAICGALVNSCDSDSAFADPVLNPFYQMDVSDLYENYMDLGADPGCKNTFTPGQKARMRVALLTSRQTLLSQDRCTSPTLSVQIQGWETPTAIQCDTAFTPKLQLRNTGTLPVTACSLLVTLNNQPETVSWQGTLAPGATISVSLATQNLPAGTYKLQTEWVSINGQTPDPGLHPTDQYRFWVVDASVPAETESDCEDLESGLLPARWKPAELATDLSVQLVSLPVCNQNGTQLLRIGKTSASPLAQQNDMHWVLMPGPVVDPGMTPMENLAFDWAHNYTANLGSMQLLLLAVPMGNCAAGVDTLWQGTNQQLHTALNPLSGPAADWQPKDCQDWQTQTIDLRGLIQGNRQLVFAFGFSGHYVAPAYMDNICWTGQRHCPEGLDIAREPGYYTASYLCQDSNGWTHFIKEASQSPVSATDLLLFSVEGTPSLEASDLRLLIGEEAAYAMAATAPYVLNSSDFYVAGRYVELLHPLEMGGDAFGVRFYFEDATTTGLAQAMGVSSLAPELLVAFTVQDGFDGRPENGQIEVDSSVYREYLPETTDPQHGWKLLDKGAYYSGTFELSTISFLGLGSGGLAAGFGARYPLPLQTFSATQKGNRHRLEWQSRRELQCTQYEVLHSRDGASFTSVGMVQAIGQDSVIHQVSDYRFDHQVNEPGLHYYALILHHRNDYKVYSDTITTRFDVSKLVSTYPNPVQDRLSLKPEFEWSGALVLELFDSRHQVFLRQEWTESNEVLIVSLPNIPPGIYFFQLQSADQIVQGKLLKAK